MCVEPVNKGLLVSGRGFPWILHRVSGFAEGLHIHTVCIGQRLIVYLVVSSSYYSSIGSVVYIHSICTQICRPRYTVFL